MLMNGFSAFIEGRSKIANSISTTFVSLCVSRILGWILLALHCALLPKSSHKGKTGSYPARLHGSCKTTGAIFQPFVFAIMCNKIEKIIASSKSGSTGVSLLLD